MNFVSLCPEAISSLLYLSRIAVSCIICSSLFDCTILTTLSIVDNIGSEASPSDAIIFSQKLISLSAISRHSLRDIAFPLSVPIEMILSSPQNLFRKLYTRSLLMSLYLPSVLSIRVSIWAASLFILISISTSASKPSRSISSILSILRSFIIPL